MTKITNERNGSLEIYVMFLAVVAVMLIVFLVLVTAYFVGIKNAEKQEILGNIRSNANAYSSGVTYSTSSVGDDAVSLLDRATSTRNICSICAMTMNGRVFLYKQATSTGVDTLGGYQIFASSSNQWPTLPACLVLDADDPYVGEVWGIDEALVATSTVSVSCRQE